MTREVFERRYAGIPERRYQGFVEHKLVDIMIISTCAVMCGLDEPEGIATFGKERIEFFRERFGIQKTPSESTLSRVFNMIDADIVVEAVIDIMRETLKGDGRVVAIDGKTICSTAKGNSMRERLHILTAYEVENGLTLGQLCIPEKTNEIPTARELLDMINVEGKVITADAMHCQRETCAKVIQRGGDYVFGLKENQPKLHEDIVLYIQDCIQDQMISVESAQTNEKNGSRYEKRTCHVAPNLDWLEYKSDWPGMRKAFAVHRITTQDGKTSQEWSYYITSLDVPAEELLYFVRAHWGIESMHWILDVVFGEDAGRVLSTNGQKTLNILRKYSIAFWKQYIAALPQKTKPTLRKTMLKALLSPQSLLDALLLSLSVIPS
jgi:predicted transposase YbfD/YdcC